MVVPTPSTYTTETEKRRVLRQKNKLGDAKAFSNEESKVTSRREYANANRHGNYGTFILSRIEIDAEGSYRVIHAASFRYHGETIHRQL